MLSTRQRLRAWAELLRLPNLLTVPGDPVAGYLLACAVLGATPGALDLLAAAAAALGLYAGGLVMNDCVDIEVDRRERPQRPLPSSRIHAPDAWFVAVLLLLGGMLIGICAGAAPWAMGLCSLILAYNFILKHHAWFAVWALAGCRGLSVLLGVAIAGGDGTGPAGLAALVVALYIGSVSRIAHDEASPERAPVGLRHLPLLAPVLGVGLLLPRAVNTTSLLTAGLAFGLFVIQHLRAARRVSAGKAPGDIPSAIGIWIRAVILLQAFACALGPVSAGPSAALILAWMLSELLGRRIASS